MTPFYCDLCHFRNIQQREARFSCVNDRSSFMFIRRANLDSLWSREREPFTRAGNLLQATKMEFYGDNVFGSGSVGTLMGPFPLEDTLGIKVACAMLRRSLDPRKWE
jgi:hypothetical protein